ncbi:hypothetical protein [Amycolatopsis sp. NPDC051371]|uniref:hypothetical protein n=1 Tax=Amycolatopsis sp. NPDC051371 TaxID=3155800 RepID=UPI003415814A
MSDGVLISWLLAFLAIGWTGGVLAGLRVGRANPTKKALKAHDEAVVRELITLIRQRQAERAEEDDDA